MRRSLKTTVLLVAAMPLLMTSSGAGAPQSTTAAVALLPTNHPSASRDVSQLWLAPESGRRERSATLIEFQSAVKLEVVGSFAKALPVFSQLTARVGMLGQYAEYYKALAELRLGRPADARRTLQALQGHPILGYLAEGAALREAEADEALNDYAAAANIYDRLSNTKTTAPDDILMRLGRAAKAAGDREKASRAFARVYYDIPLSDWALSAGAEIDNGPIGADSPRYKLQLVRADRLFSAKRYEQARKEFEALRPAATGDDRELVSLRVAECDYFLNRFRNARDQLRPYTERAARQAEALYFYALSLRELNDTGEYTRIVRQIASDFASQTWAEEALNSLATQYITDDEDAKADQVFREMYEKFPKGRYGERAAWKIGWWAYKNGAYADTVRYFEKGAADFPRSDYRPSWLYWSGRAHEALREDDLANARYVLTTADYMNSYYGRLASKRLDARGAPPSERQGALDGRRPVDSPAANDASPTAPVTVADVLPPNAPVIRALLGLDLYDQAVDELKYAQRVWGDTPVVQATLAWVYLQQGQTVTGSEQFGFLRGAINAMKRAYPQFMAAGGERLPPEILRIIFPMSYWDLIRKYSAQNGIDPYVAAALIAQESTFVPDIKSYANAVGLTQLMPFTAKPYARKMNMRYTPRLLTNPEANIRIGMAYLGDKMKEFGELHLALASYNAGERAVHRWMTERPGVEREQFIDDIPYPQTQGYVKKILGTADDYRRLYSVGALPPETAVAEAEQAVPASSPAVDAGATQSNRKKASAASPRSAKRKKTRKAA